MCRSALASLLVVATASTVACSAVLGVGDFSINPSTPDAADTGNDSGSSGLVDASEVDSGFDAGKDATADAGSDCTVNADCNSKGDYFICRKSDARCVSLQSADCSKIVGDYHNDNAVIFGSLLPTTGPDVSSGLPLQNAIEVAIGDFLAVGSLPPQPGTTARRPIVLVGCTDASDDAIAVRATKHLVDDVQVPAIIGASFSGVTIKVATEVTIPAGVLLISPSATSVAITGLQDNGLVWRTSPSDVIQAKADVAFFPKLEEHIALGLPAPARDIKVGIANKGDAYGAGLAQAISGGLFFNGKSALSQINASDPTAGNFATFDYGDATPDYPKVITGITTQKPDVVFLLGTTETITEVMKGIENAWPAGVTRPIYLLADGSLVAEATDIANNIPPTPDAPGDGLRKRIIGTIPGTSNTLFVKFQVLYNSKVTDGTSPQTGGAANAYDALYNLAYSVVAAGATPITGTSLAAGFGKQVNKAGGTLDVGSAANINTAFQKLTAGQGFDFNGASGPLDYDLTTGEASSDIQLWCLPLSGGKAQGGKPTAVFYNAQSGMLQDSATNGPGTYAKIKAECSF